MRKAWRNDRAGSAKVRNSLLIMELADDTEFEEKIKRLYIDEHFPGSGQGVTSFYRQLEAAHQTDGHSLGDVKSILMRYPAYVTQIPSRHHFPRRNVDKLGCGVQVQIDLGQMPTSPRGANYFLICIDIFSQYLYVKSLANKNSETTAQAFSDILEENPYPLAANLSSVGSDYGKEFAGAFSRMLQSKNIKLFMFRGLSKAQYAERAIRTVKGKLYTVLRGQISNQWDLLIEDIVDTLNHTYNSAIERTPSEANSVLKEDDVRVSLARNVARRNAASSEKYRNVREPEYAIGAYVYANYRRDGLSAKESDMQRGQVNRINVSVN